MPNKCLAPKYRSNYRGEPYTPVFKLPSGPPGPELVDQSLRREDIGDLKSVFVCSKHFLDQDIITSYPVLQSDGSYLEVPTKPKLVEERCQDSCPDCPPLFSSSTKQQRFDRSLKEQELVDTAIDQSLLQYHVDKELFQITTLQD